MYVLAFPVFQAYAQSDLFGKMIFWGLFILSAISWFLLIYKVWLTKKTQAHCNQFMLYLQQKKDKLLHLQMERTTVFSQPYVQVYKKLKDTTVEILNKNRFFHKSEEENSEVYLSQADIELIESHMIAESNNQSKFLEKNLFVLSTVATLAPFLGLLGTVWGILITFSDLQTHAISTSNSQILSGLSMALATTVLGLVVAIPALIAYNYLKSAVKDFVKDLDHFSHQLITTIEIQYRKVEAQK